MDSSVITCLPVTSLQRVQICPISVSQVKAAYFDEYFEKSKKLNHVPTILCIFYFHVMITFFSTNELSQCLAYFDPK